MTRNQDPWKPDFLINARGSQFANLFLENIFHYMVEEKTYTVKSAQ